MLEKINLMNLKVFTVIIAIVFSLSPIFHYIVSVPSNILSALSCIVVIVLSLKHKLYIPTSFLILCILTIFASFLFSFYWQQFKLLLYPTYFILALFSIGALSRDERKLLVVALTNIIGVIVFGAVLGFIYAIIGGTPLLTFPNPDGRESYLYLSTMSNWVLGNTIRPSGFFDEPGALSFIICFLCASRHILGMKKKTTWILLISGLVTLSMAHVIYLFFHFLSEKIDIAKFIKSFTATFLLLFLILMNDSMFDVFNKHLFNRFKVVDGVMAGDNRSNLIKNAAYLLDEKSFFWGISSDCITNVDICNIEFPAFGENFLSLITLTGLGPSFPYYISIIFLFSIGLRSRSRFVIIGISLLLLQRPNIMVYGYSPLICFFIYLVHDIYILKKKY
ncbi:hypothetical protein GNP44_05055 [Aliivibrio fischeri]|uniref:hypothetical protein n=1 Tax=Aliivibrio fischeri TaxID=668 RepID=UPI0012D8E99D|nr:hypothetical protein [Aliivibrio fischeri]MUK29471.1 hypothetical protein [Aliivibrio fischeri]